MERRSTSVRTLFRWAAAAGFVSGTAIVVGKILMLLPGPQPGEIADFASPLFGLGALVGIYLWQRSEAGAFGGVAFAVVFIGLALVLSLDFFGWPGLVDGSGVLSVGGAAGAVLSRPRDRSIGFARLMS